ncbi:DUF4397 domain-containing protein [Brevibacillus dissolubilis]|uniref:DUF4397 domain-containing protein n=1 Tax=Brevibacillus dissolubilis TaxID=1844116 RepID=UPI0011161754|nr:DUF4397 domain-containing protein [Brevibacillus dissolubilis]
MLWKKWVSRLCLMALGAFVLSAGSAQAAEGVSGQAFVRVIHASPDAPAVKVFIDGKNLLPNVVYKQASNYLPLAAGHHTIEIYPTDALAGATPLIKQNLTLQAGKKVSAAAIGELAKIRLQVVDDELASTANMAKVRFVHASPDTNAVDVALAGSTVLASNLGFSDVSSYIEVGAPAQLNVEMRQAGTDKALVAFPTVSVDPATIYSVYVVGYSGGKKPGVEALIFTDKAVVTP